MKVIKPSILTLLLIVSICIQAQYKTDKPKTGEGISAFLKRNNRTEKADYEQFLDINKGKFDKNNGLRRDIKYNLPPIDKDKKVKKDKVDKTSTNKKAVVRRNNLFGKKYAEYTVKSDKLKGASFYLCSGHGGPDPGAVAKVDGNVITEDEYAYDIILRLARILLEEGATVHIIIQDAQDGIRDERFLKNTYRETCMGDAIPKNQNARLKQRCVKINKLSQRDKSKYKRSVFLHLDSRENIKTRIDVFFYHSPNSTEGKKLVDTMLKTFNSKYNEHQPNRGYSGTGTSRNLYVLNNTKPVGLYAELGNIQNSFDQRRFLNYENRQALASWLALGLIKDYEDFKMKK